ncbi:metallo-beta-lactamase domain-containing protein 1 isoform X1 [Nylanderia fulva]|uniref:metallo-beta-lactamase domain-containing protein 1 isoform X1 n=1 Tax=Nylanderia fulva TaxID=613905 RepID=UPI0010FB152A|nr:metallo-beta-lactamase domain-containing protein 1 isoform X1 [Nylanderia fulva]
MLEVIVLFDGYSEELPNGRMDANCTCTLIKSTKLIIVDTMTAWDREKIIAALAKHDITPQNIDYVVCTHSHPDHIGNNNLFTNATHIVGLLVQQGTMFYEDPRIPREGYELCPGVNVIATPGHTAEDVSVVVNTMKNGKKTVIAITGDLFENMNDIFVPSIWKSLGTPELVKTQSLMRSRIITLADSIIPGHGPMFNVTSTMRELVTDQILK